MFEWLNIFDIAIWPKGKNARIKTKCVLEIVYKGFHAETEGKITIHEGFLKNKQYKVILDGNQLQQLHNDLSEHKMIEWV